MVQNFNQNKAVYNPNCISATIIGQGHCGNEPKIIQKQGDRGTNKYSVSENSYTIPANPMSDRGQLLVEPTVQIKQATKQGYIECKIGGVADLSYPESKTRRGRVQDNGDTCPIITATETGVCKIEPSRTDSQKYIDNISSEYEFAKAKCQEMLDENGNLPEMFNPYNKVEITDYAPTQTTSCNRSCSSATVLKKESDYRIRKLTPKECFRLMGFTDEDFYKAKQSGTSDSQLYKQAGNSIVVNALFEIFLELYKAMPYLFDDLRLSSYFSGIGAFEKALDMLYEYINTGDIKQLNFTRPQAV